MISPRQSLLVVVCAVLAATGCPSKNPTASVPAQAHPPALAATTAPQAETKSGAAPTPVPTAKAPDLPPVPQVDPVPDLVAQIERLYQNGQDNYRAGHFEAAKSHFDLAYNLLMASSTDVHSDPRLEQEMDKILEALNLPELAALHQADVTEQKSEPAPIDEANEITPPVDAAIKAKAEAEIKSTHSDLPLMLTDQVAGYINYFSGRGRGVLERGLIRSGKYEDMIRATLKEEGVPQDLIYLAQAESGFHPLAVSRAGARGLWQFMGSRARGYGLQRNMWIDERQDPEKSTRAAARHLKDLYEQFGDWYLAMAAYNSGPGTVQSAVKRTGYADFWELYRRNVLPKETRNYVPIIVAVTIMAKNPEQYDLDQIEREKPAAYDSIRINYPIDLRLAAQCIDASAADLQELNPSLLRLTTPRDRPFELRLPAGTKDQFESTVAAIPSDKRLWWRLHTVQSGETLASISKTYHTTAKAITEANKLEDNSLEADSRLIIPIASGKYSETGTYARRITRYRVHKGDTVESVAENFGVPPKMVRSWNRLKGNSLAGRRVLYLHLPVTPGAPGEQAASKKSSAPRKPAASTSSTATGSVVHHTVKSGETLYSIANSYNTTVAALQRDNQNTDPLRPGTILVVRDAR